MSDQVTPSPKTAELLNIECVLSRDRPAKLVNYFSPNKSAIFDVQGEKKIVRFCLSMAFALAQGS